MRQPAVRPGEITGVVRLSSSHRELGRRWDATSRRWLAWGAKTRAVVGLLLAGVANTACYTYSTVPFSSVSPNEDVRLRVTERAAAELASELGTFSTELDGRLNHEGRDSLKVGVPVDRSYRGITIGTTTQTVMIARSDVLDVRRRQFSRSRTILVSAGAAIGFGLLAAGISQLVDPNGSSDDQPSLPPPPAYRGFIRFHIPLP